MSANLRPLFRSNLADLTEMAGVRIQALKELTIVANIEYWDNIGTLLSILQQCPIEHIVLHVHNSVGAQRLVQSALQLLSSIWETVLAWKSRQSKAQHSMKGVANDTFTAKGKTDTSDVAFLSQRYKGLDRLDIHLTGELCAQFQSGCQHLMTFTASIDMCDPSVVVSLVDSHRRTLWNVNLTCGSDMKGYTASRSSGGSSGPCQNCDDSSSLQCVEPSREESSAAFNGGLRLEDQDDGSTSVARTTKIRSWACQHLERLAI